MNLNYKKWRQFLNEDSANTFPFRIFCDMDGVLVDLASGILNAAHQDAADERQRAAVMKIFASGKEWKTFKKNKRLQKGLKFIHDTLGNDVSFWASLPPQKDARALWTFISDFEPFVLSAPWDAASAKGKMVWLSGLAKNLDPLPPQTRIILTHNKHEYAINNETGHPNILIDDMDKYVVPWRQAGGIAIQHTSASTTIRELKRIMEEYKQTGTTSTDDVQPPGN